MEVVRSHHAHPPRVASATYVQVIRRLHIQGSMQSPLTSHRAFAIVPAPCPVQNPARHIRPAAAAVPVQPRQQGMGTLGWPADHVRRLLPEAAKKADRRRRRHVTTWRFAPLGSVTEEP
eukprot:s935_g3.t1